MPGAGTFELPLYRSPKSGETSAEDLGLDPDEVFRAAEGRERPPALPTRDPAETDEGAMLEDAATMGSEDSDEVGAGTDEEGRLGRHDEHLRHAGLDAGLQRDKLEECRPIAGTTGQSLDRVILEKEYLDEEALLTAYAQHLGYEFRKSARRHEACPRTS